MTTATTSTSSTSAASAGTTTPGSTNLNESTTRWRDTATLTDARKGLSSVKFAPRHLRLQLATASADGVVRIYEGMWMYDMRHMKLQSFPPFFDCLIHMIPYYVLPLLPYIH